MDGIALTPSSAPAGEAIRTTTEVEAWVEQVKSVVELKVRMKSSRQRINENLKEA